MIKRITFYLAKLNAGGAQGVMINLANEFSKQGYEIDLVVGSAKGEMASRVNKGVRIINYGFRKNMASKSILPFVWYLLSRKPDVVVTTLRSTNIAVTIAWTLAHLVKRKSSVLILRESCAITDHNYKSSLSKRMLFLTSRFWYGFADMVVHPSNASKNSYLTYSGTKTIKKKVIPNPVVNKELYQMSNECPHHQWYKDRNIKVILGAGRLTYQKNFELLIRSFYRVACVDPSIRLIIIGEGPDREKLTLQCAKLGILNKVFMPGFQENPYSFMKASSLFVLSSRHEGLPNVLIQAMACGTPVIATDCPGGSCEIITDGKSGRLVPIDDEIIMADAIKEMLTCPTSREILLESSSRYNQNQVAGQYSNLFQELIHERNGKG
ncbi:MAG: glycosyltransferase [Balneolales bacterium]